jgi:broad specificity phosphatase PhoE
MEQTKKVYFIRHGESMYNAWRKQSIFNIQPFYPKDKEHSDPPLSEKGLQQANEVHKAIAISKEFINANALNQAVVYCSPLKRAIETAISIFQDGNIPIIAHPLLRERMDCIADAGTTTSLLQLQYKNVNFSHVPSFYWASSEKLAYTVIKEKNQSVKQRISEFIKIIKEDKHALIYVVGHSNFHAIWAKRLIKLNNCEVQLIDSKLYNA